MERPYILVCLQLLELLLVQLLLFKKMYLLIFFFLEKEGEREMETLILWAASCTPYRRSSPKPEHVP